MAYNEFIYLVRPVNSGEVDEYGDPVVERSKRGVFAEVGSVGMKEFYQAQTAGFKPEISFTISDYYDYNDEPMVEYRGVTYKVLRTYRTDRNELNIICYEGVRNVGT